MAQLTYQCRLWKEIFMLVQIHYCLIKYPEYCIMCLGEYIFSYLKESFKDVPVKRCSENMQQIYRRTLMWKCDFNVSPVNSISSINFKEYSCKFCCTYSERLFIRVPPGDCFWLPIKDNGGTKRVVALTLCLYSNKGLLESWKSCLIFCFRK